MVLPPPWHRQRTSLGLHLSRDMLAAGVPRAAIPIGSHLLFTRAVGHTSSALVHISIERLRSRRSKLDSPLNDTFFSAVPKGSR